MVRRLRETLDENNQVANSDYLTVLYIRIQPVTQEVPSKAPNDKTSSLLYTGQKIFFTPYVDILPTDKIEYDAKLYEIKSYYKAKDRYDIVHHLEVII